MAPMTTWGHALITPDGAEIRVPKSAFPKLKRLGLLVGRKAELSPLIYQFLDPVFDTLTDGLRHLLGPDLSGPEWVQCNCRECMRREEESDRTRMPFTVNRQARPSVQPASLTGYDKNEHGTWVESRRLVEASAVKQGLLRKRP